MHWLGRWKFTSVSGSLYLCLKIVYNVLMLPIVIQSIFNYVSIMCRYNAVRQTIPHDIIRYTNTKLTKGCRWLMQWLHQSSVYVYRTVLANGRRRWRLTVDCLKESNLRQVVRSNRPKWRWNRNMLKLSSDTDTIYNNFWGTQPLYKPQPFAYNISPAST